MPAYEYLCQTCGQRFERRQKMSDPEIDACPACGGPVQRLISGGAGAIVKGGSCSAEPCCATGACPAMSPCCGPACGCGN